MIQMDDRESALVLEILRNVLGDLRMTIVDTENYEWRQDMKHKEEQIKQLIGRLEASTGQTVSR